MNAKELRIGNLVNVGGCTIDTYQTYTPSIVNIGMLKLIQEENKERPDAILSIWQPIFLTEEWLLRFGFVKQTNNSKYWSKNNVDIDLNEWFGFNNMVAKIPLKYVHQLQNLYFALTGQELEIIS